MLLATRKTKNNLVRTVLASGVLISSMAYMNPAYAVLQALGAASTDTDAKAIAAGVDYDQAGPITFTVKDKGNGRVFGDTGTVSVGNSGGDVGNILIFEGQSAVSGSITDIAAPVAQLTVQGGKAAGGNGVVTVAGNAKALAVTVGAAGPGGGGGLTLTGANQLKVSGTDLTVQGVGTTLIVGGATTVNQDVLLKDTSSSTFTGAATVTRDVKLTESSNAAFTSDLTARDLDIQGVNHTVTVGGNLVLTRDLIGKGTGTSTLAVNGTSTITAGSGQLNASENFRGTFTGNVDAKQIKAQDTSILTFNGQGNSTTAVVQLAGDATINFNGGGTAAAGLQLADTSTVNFFNANYAVNGADLDRGDQSTIGVGTGVTVTVGGGNDMTDAGAGSKLLFDLGNTITPGKFNVGGTATIGNSQIVTITNYNLGLLDVGTTLTQNLVTDAGGGVASLPTLVAPNNPFISFTLEIANANKELNLVMARQVPAGLDGNSSSLGGVFAQIDDTNASGELLALIDGLGDIATSPEALNEELAEIAPQGINGSLVDSSFGVTNETFDLFSQRINELRAGVDSYNTGYAAGHMTEKGHGTWVKVFGSHADQNRRGNIAGYTGETWGLAGGADIMITDRHLVGVSLAWASTDVNFDSQRGGSDINSYQGAFYGSWNVTTPLYVNWMASAAFNKYKETQIISTGGFNQTSLGEFDGWQYGARAEVGYIFGEECFHIIPTADLTYTHASFDSFQQKGNSTANQIIDYGSVSALLAGVGVKFSYDYEMEKALLQPEAHVNVSYDIIGDEMDANSRFVGFGTSYNVQGASVKRTDYNVGLSLTTYGDSGLGFSISYDYDWKSGFHAHSGFARIRYEW